MRAVPQFEADLDPETRVPRIRFNFANGWSASVVLRVGKNGCDANMALLAACPTGEWGSGRTELGDSEASAADVVAWLQATSSRPSAEG